MSNNNLNDFFDSLKDDAPMKPKSSTKVVDKTKSTVTSPAQFALNPVVVGAVDKINNIRKELNDMFIEREDVIDIALLALAGGFSALLLGEPGTGKSKLIRELCSRVDNANYFQWLLNKTSDPSELLGGFSIKGMEQDKFLRITKGKLPEAHIAFLDEIFKSNEPTLNILLSLINEKIFFNDGVATPVPLISLFGASNELPDDEEALAAFYDRLLFRVEVKPIHNAQNQVKMLENYVHERSNRAVNKTTLTINELLLIQEEAKKVIVSPTVLNNFVKLLTSLSKINIKISDRRKNECIRILQTAAILKNRCSVGNDLFRELAYVLSDSESKVLQVRSEIEKYSNPYATKLKEYQAKFEEIKATLTNVNAHDNKQLVSIKAKGTLENLLKKINRASLEAKSEGIDTPELSMLGSQIDNFIKQEIKNALGLNFA